MLANYECDLHGHTNRSDGNDSPVEYIRHAVHRGVKILAITDHDIVPPELIELGGGKRQEITAYAKGVGVELLRGIEISCETYIDDVHLVCLGCDWNAPYFKELDEFTINSKVNSYRKLIDLLNEQGMEITWEEVLQNNGYPVQEQFVQKKMIFELMARKGYMESWKEAKLYVKNSKKTCVCFSVDIDASNYTLAEKNLLFDILFEGEFCKIHQELSEKKGYVYSYDPCFQHYNNIGQMTLTYEVLPKHLYDSVETVVEVLKSMKEGITDELSYVLPHYVDNAGFLLDDTEEFNWVRAYEGHILDVYYKDIEERTESYRRVTTERMTEICREVFRQSNILLTVKGKKKKVDTERLAEILCDALSCR